MVCMWGQLQVSETGAENSIKWHEKETQTRSQIDAKSSQRLGGVRGTQKCFHIIVGEVVWESILEPVLCTNQKNTFRKGIPNHSKTMSQFETKGVTKRGQHVLENQVFL